MPALSHHINKTISNFTCTRVASHNPALFWLRHSRCSRPSPWRRREFRPAVACCSWAGR